MRGLLWDLAGPKGKRVRGCGRSVVSSDGVTLRATRGNDGRTSAGFHGLKVCGSVWLCPVCSAKIAARRTDELHRAFRGWLGQGNTLAAGTFTMRHAYGDDLGDLWDGLTGAWRAMTSGAAWSWTPTARRPAPGLRQRFDMAGFLRVTEVTVGANGWHVHLHVLFFLRGERTQADADVIGSVMRERWADALDRLGFSMVDEAQDFRLIREPEHVTEWAGYANKQTFDPERFRKLDAEARAVALEHGQGMAKVARGKNRTPFKVLFDLAEGLDRETGEVGPDYARDLAIWRQWEEGSAGRRQQCWSKGLRDLLALGDELTDEQLAEDEQLGGADVARFHGPAWAALVTRPTLPAELLDATEQAADPWLGAEAFLRAVLPSGGWELLPRPDAWQG